MTQAAFERRRAGGYTRELRGPVRGPGADADAGDARSRGDPVSSLDHVRERLGPAPAVMGVPEWQQALAVLLDVAVESFSAERGFWIVPGATPAELTVELARGFDRETLSCDPRRVSRTVVGRVLERGRGLVTTGEDDSDVTASESVLERRVLSILCAPLFAGGAVRRLLYLDHRFQLDAFSPEDLQVLQTFGERLAAPLAVLDRAARSGSPSEEAREAWERLGAAGAALEHANQRPFVRVTSLDEAQQRKRVVVVDHDPLARHGLNALINQQHDLIVAALAGNRLDALRVVEAVSPEVVVVDLALERGGGLDLLKDIKTRHPDMQCLAISLRPEPLYAERALQAGARGYVSKQDGPDALLVALRKVAGGELFVGEETARLLLGRVAGGDPVGRAPLERLSDRELQVFELLGRGRGTSEIARELCLSIKTVETHRANIKRKLNLRTGQELLQQAFRWAQEQGLA